MPLPIITDLANRQQFADLLQSNPGLIILKFGADWCGPCKLMDKKTFQNRDVAAYISEHYYAVKFNAEGNEILTFKGKRYENPNYDPKKAKRRNSLPGKSNENLSQF